MPIDPVIFNILLNQVHLEVYFHLGVLIILAICSYIIWQKTEKDREPYVYIIFAAITLAACINSYGAILKSINPSYVALQKFYSIIGEKNARF